MKKVNRILDSMISDIDKVKLGLYEASTKRKKQKLFYCAMYGIYPDKDKAYADRGVKYANGALGEVNDNYLPFGILVEVAHHDYYEDALWIMQNKKLIGYNIADSILKYYQIIE